MSSEKPLPFIYQFAAGAVAGVSEILVMYPLDVVKTRVQLQQGKGIGEEGYNGMVDCFRKIIKNEGFSRLYRGITAPILMEAPKRATKFAANDEWGKLYRNMFNMPKMTQGLSILTGASAGATEAFVVVPFELVKIRLQDKAQAGRYSGLLDCVTKIVRAEGPLALYNGLESTLWRHILWNAGYFGCIFQVRALLPKPTNKKAQITNDLISGAVGGTVGTILNTPMDVVKSRIQNSPKIAGSVPKYNWAWPALGTVMREEGFSALYKGFLPKVLRLGPGGGILLVVFTAVTDFFRRLNVLNAAFNPHNISFILAGTSFHEYPEWAAMIIESTLEIEMKAALRRGNYSDLNLYFISDISLEIDDPDVAILGYSTLPRKGVLNGFDFFTDGCLVLARTLPGGLGPALGIGKAAVHEVGHWLGLLHPFHNFSCSGPGDFVDDTPAQSEPSLSCIYPKDSCPQAPGLDSIRNYMDYAPADCSTEFTQGQAERMRGLFWTLRIGR